MSLDSCDDEGADSPPTTVDKLSVQRATNTTQSHQEATKCWDWNRPTTWNWNVVFNGMLAVTTAFLAYLAYYQLESAHVEQRAWVSMKQMDMTIFKGRWLIVCRVNPENACSNMTVGITDVGSGIGKHSIDCVEARNVQISARSLYDVQ